MKHIKLFEYLTDYSLYMESKTKILPNVCYCKDAPDIIHVNPRELKALCFIAEAPNSTVTLIKNGSPTNVTLEISNNGKLWKPYSIGNTVTLTDAGNKVYFRNTSETQTSFSTSSSSCYLF